jgi:hypothetical protein
VDISSASGACPPGLHKARNVGLLDFDSDGLLDLVLTIHHAPARNRVYLNVGLRDGVPQFRDVTEQAGLGQAVPMRCPHVEIQDFDNDGWPDIYTSAAWLEGDGQVVPLVFRHAGLRDGVPQFTAPRPLLLVIEEPINPQP